MATNGQVTARYAKAAPGGVMLRPKANNVYVSPDGRTIYSYGSHFPMAHIMPAEDGTPRGWWLVNGDKYSVTTSHHQSDLRSCLARTGLPVLIVPFSALREAGIRRDTITPVEILPDSYEIVWHSEPKPAGTYAYDYRNDGAEWASRVHHLGASVFTADTRSGWSDYGTPIMATCSYLSAFDNQERFGLYFLAELPDGVMPQTVAEAFTALRPAMVQEADAAGVKVTRQGDVFAIQTGLTTRELTRAGAVRPDTAYVLGVNHTATDVRVLGDETYARGILRHRPRESWRRPEHRMQRMGDGKTWHRVVKNTVPDGRSWSAGGNVD